MHAAFSSTYTSVLIITFPKIEVNCGVFQYKSTEEFNYVIECINTDVTGIIKNSSQVIL